MSKKILLIDDDEDEQIIFLEALKESGAFVKCYCAITAEQGLKISQNLLPDFIFLDINMPVLNGLQCLEIIKKDDTLNKIPVIIYSTGINDKVYEKALNKGAVACIKKQNSVKDLAGILKNFLS